MRLHDVLQRKGISVRVAYSSPPEMEVAKDDNGDLAAPLGTKVKGYWFGGGRLLYQPLWHEVSSANLVVVEQANKHLVNLLLRPYSMMCEKKIAFWGHGKDRKGNPDSLSEQFKRRSLCWVDWWFAYTQKVADYVASVGFPPGRITTVDNSIDTEAFKKQLNTVDSGQVAQMRSQLSIDLDARIGLFCGSIYREKEIALLIQSAIRIRAALPMFHLVVIGGGPEAKMVRSAAVLYPWIHYLGPAFGNTKATCFRMADLFLMPAAVGLSILDAFCASLPLITVDVPSHGPEIDYLQHERNGLIVNRDAQTYAEAVLRVLKTPAMLYQLQEGARESAEKYTLENMASKFASGIQCCLQVQS